MFVVFVLLVWIAFLLVGIANTLMRIEEKL
jgi:hypothetical protein